jgi:hypothetical protein
MDMSQHTLYHPPMRNMILSPNPVGEGTEYISWETYFRVYPSQNTTRQYAEQCYSGKRDRSYTVKDYALVSPAPSGGLGEAS